VKAAARTMGVRIEVFNASGACEERRRMIKSSVLANSEYLGQLVA
jgi:hypothetical protein